MCIRDRGFAVFQLAAGLSVQIRAELGKGLHILVLGQLDTQVGIGPVSYTHLDVYKRQVQGDLLPVGFQILFTVSRLAVGIIDLSLIHI